MCPGIAPAQNNTCPNLINTGDERMHWSSYPIVPDRAIQVYLISGLISQSNGGLGRSNAGYPALCK